jgi:hypothetical protein
MQFGRWFSKRKPPGTGRSSWPERLIDAEPGSEPSEQRSARVRHPSGAVVVSVLVALALALVLLGALRTAGGWGGGDSTARSGSGRSGPGSSAALSSSGAPGPEDLVSCRALLSLQQGVLDAARPAMGQWEVHIRAMNQLVAGQITLAQATAFWNSTRVQAARRIQEFRAADRLFRSTAGSLCSVATRPPPRSSSDLRACIEAVVARAATVQAARTTMVTWSHHVRDMERLRMGMLSPAMAQTMWRQLWKRGDQELRTYRQDDATARGLRCSA